jgi:sialate O-acetylesterase
MHLPQFLQATAIVFFSTSILHADISLPAIISDHMVLEKTESVPLWGKADPGEKITVTLAGQSSTTTAGPDGKWTVSLNLSDIGQGPFEMTFEGNNKITIADVVVGEVWLASGQSNMQWELSRTANAAPEIANSANPLLRHFEVKRITADEPAHELEGAWQVASPETSGSFSAVGYYFAKKLQSELQVPVGVINSSWGGTPAEAWTSPEAIATNPDLQAASTRLQEEVANFPGLRETYIKDFAAWLKSNNREDKPVADASQFAAPDLSADGWTTIRVPGKITGPDLPKAGAIWLRKEITISGEQSNPLELNLPLRGFDSVYWNGNLLHQTSYADYPDYITPRRSGPFNIPPKDIKPGTNVLAIRIYQPAEPAEFTGEPKAGPRSLSGDWLAKAEFELPTLTDEKIASIPKPPAPATRPQNIPTFLYNSMIHPLLPYAISGVIWYQGESNSSRAEQYRTTFPLLINDWRARWGREDLPFYFCQLANYKAKTSDFPNSDWAELRESQALTLSLPHTGQAVLIDTGEARDIHPINKKDAGERLARIALANDYGKSIPYSGPVYDKLILEGNKAILSFTHTDGGLVAAGLPETYDVNNLANEKAPLVRNSPNSQLEGFAICGEDRKWGWADATIDGDTVVVSSQKVPNPIAVRYAWADNPTCNLYNGAGLPASPFRTDDFPLSTAGKKL